MKNTIEEYNKNKSNNLDDLVKISNEIIGTIFLTSKNLQDFIDKGFNLIFKDIKAKNMEEITKHKDQRIIIALNHPTTFDIFGMNKIAALNPRIKVVTKLQNEERFPEINKIQKSFSKDLIFSNQTIRMVSELKNNTPILLCPFNHLDEHLTDEVLEEHTQKLIKLASMTQAKIIFGKISYDYKTIPFKKSLVEFFPIVDFTEIDKIRQLSKIIVK